MILKVENLSISYGNNIVVDNLSFDILEGELLLVCGKNGAGKSSICLAIAGLISEEATVTGKIVVDGKEFCTLTRAEKSQLLGIIFQNPETQLFSPTVEDELSFAPENLCLDREEIEKRICYALELCDISHLRKRETNSLSGGEKQLVAIASVLTMKPKILLADEITSRIDCEGRIKIRACLKNYAQEGKSVLFISHNKDDKEICNRILTLDKGKCL